MRQQKLRRAPAIVSDLIDTTAALKQKAANQRAGMMHPARRRPAVRAAENGGAAKDPAHPRQFTGNKSESLVPVHLPKTIRPAARSSLPPAFADRRARNSQG